MLPSVMDNSPHDPQVAEPDWQNSEILQACAGAPAGRAVGPIGVDRSRIWNVGDEQFDEFEEDDFDDDFDDDFEEELEDEYDELDDGNLLHDGGEGLDDDVGEGFEDEFEEAEFAEEPGEGFTEDEDEDEKEEKFDQ
jgi:hypothetical protein